MGGEVKATIITGILGLVATITAAFIGKDWGEKNAVEQLFSQVTTVNGDNNTVTVNSVDDFVAQYNKLLNENETLKAQNSQYFSDYTEQKNIRNSLESQLSERPEISYNNLGLCIDAKDIAINRNNSIVMIDGREYLSKEIAEKLLDENQNMIIKDDTLFIGKVVADRANLVDQDVIEVSGDFVNGEKVTDSYGNTHLNAIYCKRYDGRIIYNLKQKYNFLECSFSIEENGNIDQYTTIIIKVDDTQVYSIEITKLDKPVTNVEIPINSCSLLQISCENEDGSCSCIISDAILYN